MTENLPTEKSQEDFSIRFQQERQNWTNRISDITKLYTKLTTLDEAQIHTYSTHQEAREYMYKLMNVCNKLNNSVKQIKKDKFLKYKKDYDLKLTGNEIAILLDGDLSEILHKIQVLNTQIDFMKDTISLLNHMCYGINYRVQIEQLKKDL